MRLVPYIVLAGLVCAGCSSGYYAARADRDVDRILDRVTRKTVGRLEEEAVRPAPAAAQAPMEFGETRILKLPDALKTAVTSNRDFLAAKENVYLAALDLTGTRRDFGPVVGMTLNYLYADGPYVDRQADSGATVSVSQILPTGTEASVSATSLSTELSDGDDSAGTTVSLSLRQPLLAGRGKEASHEALTAAQRRVIYRVREFERYRQGFTINMVRSYYEILSEKQVVENTKRDHELSVFLRRRAEARFTIGEVSALDKFRAQQQELEAKNGLITQKETYEAKLDEFKISLGMPIEARIDVQDEWPDMVPVRLDEASAVQAAMANRLDLRNEKDREEDAERAVRIAKSGLLPEVDLTATWSLDSEEATGFDDQEFDAGEYSVGVSVTVPIDKISERNAYRAAVVSLDRQRRGYALKQDRVKQEVRNALRQVRRLEDSVGIQDTKRKLAERRLKNARYLFDEGSAGNRDVVDAQEDLLEAENAYVRSLASYEVARLELTRALGVLFIKPDGSWRKQ